MFIRIQEKLVPFKVNAIVIDHLSDPINIGINFLKEFNVSLIFKTGRPLELFFEGLGSKKAIKNNDFYKNHQISNELPLLKPIIKQNFEPKFKNFFRK